MKLVAHVGPVQDVLHAALGSSLRLGYALVRLECPVGDRHAYSAVKHPKGRVRALVLAYEVAFLHGQRNPVVEMGIWEDDNPLPVNVIRIALNSRTVGKASPARPYRETRTAPAPTGRIKPADNGGFNRSPYDLAVAHAFEMTVKVNGKQ